jgi:hypothetical protein
MYLDITRCRIFDKKLPKSKTCQKGMLAPFSVGEKFRYSSVAQCLFGSKRFFETGGQWANTVTAK